MVKTGELERQLYAVIEDQNGTVVQAARVYKKMILRPNSYEWREINTAIIERWSVTGLERIKQLAWSPQPI